MSQRARLVTIESEPMRGHVRIEQRTMRVEPVRSHAHAVQVLSDEAFLAYARVEAEKLYQALIKKRWPQLQ